MVALTGDARGKRVEILKGYNIGRMFVGHTFRIYEGEKWGFDNGAFKDFLQGKRFDGDRYLRTLEKSIKLSQRYHGPYLAVLPDIVGGGQASLELSISWLERELSSVPFNWYLAVQDGMDPLEVKNVLKSYKQIKGIFLGGTDEFKLTAAMWSSLAHSLGLKFHYARAGSIKKIKHAFSVKADSIDSSLPLWSEEKFSRFIKALHPTAELPLFQNYHLLPSLTK